MGKRESASFVVSKQFEKFGTEIDFQIVVGNESKIVEARKNLERAEEKCDEIEKIFSRFDLKSELMVVNSGLGKSLAVSEKFLEVAKLALKYNKDTQGYFDPRIIEQLENSGYGNDFKQIVNAKLPKGEKVVDFERELEEDLIVGEKEIIFKKRMDFSGIVKGFAVDQITKFFSECGWKNFLVDCGGDMFFRGKDKNGKSWYVDIEGISYQTLMLELKEKGIATSGIGKRKWEIEGKRFHHLVNPKKCGQYCFDLKSVTVVADCACRADIWAKTLFVMGSETAKSFARENELACAMLDYRGGIWISNEFKKYLHQKNVQEN